MRPSWFQRKPNVEKQHDPQNNRITIPESNFEDPGFLTAFQRGNGAADQ